MVSIERTDYAGYVILRDGREVGRAANLPSAEIVAGALEAGQVDPGDAWFSSRPRFLCCGGAEEVRTPPRDRQEAARERDKGRAAARAAKVAERTWEAGK